MGVTLETEGVGKVCVFIGHLGGGHCERFGCDLREIAIVEVEAGKREGCCDLVRQSLYDGDLGSGTVDSLLFTAPASFHFFFNFCEIEFLRFRALESPKLLCFWALLTEGQNSAAA